MCKKAISILLSLMIIIAVITAVPVYASAETSEDFEYQILEDGTAVISDYLGSNTDLTIPEKIEGHTVSYVNLYTPEDSEDDTNIITIRLPGTIDFKESSFPTCLENLFFTSDNPDYTSVDGIVYSKDMTKIEYFPKAHKGVYIMPETVTDIGGAFFRCSGITEVVLPDGLKDLGHSIAGAFYQCTSLKKVNIPSSITEIPARSFTECTSLESIEIPDSVTTIGGLAFSGCESLKNVVLPDTLREVGCGPLSSFVGTPWREKLFKDNPNGMIYIGTLAYEYNGDCPAKVAIKDGTKAINKWCFRWRTALEEITIPNSVESIGDQSFVRCKNLKSVTIPNSVKSIGSGAFDECTSLESVTIQNGVENIGNKAFYGCEKLKSVTVPKSVTKIEDYAIGYIRGFVYDEEYHDSYDTDVKIDGFVIYGYKDTEAERYAKENEISFVALEENTELLGDTDGDGKITIIDATYIQRYLVHLKVLSFYAELADVNGDGIDITDATYIQRKISEIEIPYPVGEPINKT